MDGFSHMIETMAEFATLTLKDISYAGTELRGKNLVASRDSKFKKLLALTKIQWPSIMHECFGGCHMHTRTKKTYGLSGGQR